MRWRGEGAWEDAETRNIGVGGAFIATEAPAPVGAAILVELHIPTSERPFEARAIVRWRQTVAPAAADAHSVDAPGMGVEFVQVDIDVLLELNDYFATLSAEHPTVR
jgi:uncharacterized protein (TIGR02266 family)